MSKAVFYTSETGFTKQYAQWIAAALQCPCLSAKAVSAQSVASYDTVIYGGWIMGSGITGLDKMRPMVKGKLVVFGVGSSPKSEAVEKAIQQQNHLDGLPFFYMEGGFHFEQLGFMKKTMLKMVKKSVEKKENKTEQDLFMVKVLGTSFDHSDIHNIDPLVEACRE